MSALSDVLGEFLHHAAVHVDQAAAAELLPLVVKELENLEARLTSHEARLAGLGGYEASGGKPGGGAESPAAPVVTPPPAVTTSAPPATVTFTSPGE